MADYPDKNNNGVPDVFENRKPITEILNEIEEVLPPSALLPSDQIPTIVEDQIHGFTSSRQLAETHDTTRALLQQAEERIAQLTKRLSAALQRNQELTVEITRLRNVTARKLVTSYVPRDGSTEQCVHCDTYCMIQHGGLEVHHYPRTHSKSGRCPGSQTLDIRQDCE